MMLFEMLNALLRGKLGDKRLNEDALTAIVFSRLAYLEDASLAWKLLLTAMRPPPTTYGAPEAPFTPGAQDRFIPRLWDSLAPAEQDSQRSRIEPDVLLRHSAGWIVVEAKQVGRGGDHTHRQLRLEVDALRRLAGTIPVGLILLEPPERAESVVPSGVPWRALRWVALADVISARIDEGGLSPAAKCLLEDLLTALSLAGAAPLAPLHKLGQGCPPLRELRLGRSARIES